MKFSRYVFLLAAFYGVCVLVPGFFAGGAGVSSSGSSPALPEFYFGFLSLAIVFQGMFVVIAIDPIKFRPFMLIAVFEKLSFFLVVVVLASSGRMSTESQYFLGGMIDGGLAALFLTAWLVTPSLSSNPKL